MTFTARERFIHHVTVVMTLHLAQKRSKPVVTMSEKRMSDLISLFLKNRCRKLTGDDVTKIYHDIEEEVLFSGPIFDMAKNWTEPKEDWK